MPLGRPVPLLGSAGMIFPLTRDPVGPILAVQPGWQGQFMGRKADGSQR
jgi:hypothetical protein